MTTNTLPPITTAARRLARASRDRWTTYFDAEGTEVAQVYDTTGNVFGPRSHDDYAIRVVGKVSQREAADLLEAWRQLTAEGVEPGDIHLGAMSMMISTWDFEDGSDMPRSSAREVIARWVAASNDDYRYEDQEW